MANEVFAYWDSKENQPQLTLTMTLHIITQNLTKHRQHIKVTRKFYS